MPVLPKYGNEKTPKVTTEISPQERRQRICERVQDGRTSIPDLAQEFSVAEITIRRDLGLLEKEGRILCIRGGAMPNNRVAYEFSFREKEKRCEAEKAAIGSAAARIVEPGQAVFVDTGTTALAAARCLRTKKPDVIVTVNLCVASEFVGQGDVRVLVPGGELARNSPDLYGEWTLDVLSRITVDVAFLGCDRVDPQEGFSCADPRSAAVSRLILNRSRRAYLLADNTKFGESAFCRIASLDRLTGIITDSGLSKEFRKSLSKQGIDLITIKTRKERS